MPFPSALPVLVSGSLAYDRIMRFPGLFKDHIFPNKLDAISVSFAADQLEESLGGVGGNIAYALNMVGQSPFLVSTLGKDAASYLAAFERLGIETAGIAVHPTLLSATASIISDDAGGQITGFFTGPLAHGRPIGPLPSDLKIALISPSTTKVMQAHLKECSALGLTTVFDPGQRMTELTAAEMREMILQAKVVIGNEYEMSLLSGKTGWSAQDILNKAPLMITTLGRAGCKIERKGEKPLIIPAILIRESIDPTGAGDAFRGGFFAAYAHGAPLTACAQLGCAVASFCLEHQGCQTYSFTFDELNLRYQAAYGQPINLTPSHD